jgi:hypothetical protein
MPVVQITLFEEASLDTSDEAAKRRQEELRAFEVKCKGDGTARKQILESRPNPFPVWIQEAIRATGYMVKYDRFNSVYIVLLPGEDDDLEDVMIRRIEDEFFKAVNAAEEHKKWYHENMMPRESPKLRLQLTPRSGEDKEYLMELEASMQGAGGAVMMELLGSVKALKDQVKRMSDAKAIEGPQGPSGDDDDEQLMPTGGEDVLPTGVVSESCITGPVQDEKEVESENAKASSEPVSAESGGAISAIRRIFGLGS